MIKAVVGIASEAEVSAVHANARKGVPHRFTLMKLDHPQHQTPLGLDNSTSYGILTNTLIPKKSKSIDMRYFWSKDTKNQK